MIETVGIRWVVTQVIPAIKNTSIHLGEEMNLSKIQSSDYLRQTANNPYIFYSY